MSVREHIDRFHMMVIVKYFESISDFMNIVIVNKKYEGITEMYKYNPIPLNNERSRMMFSNIRDTAHVQ